MACRESSRKEKPLFLDKLNKSFLFAVTSLSLMRSYVLTRLRPYTSIRIHQQNPWPKIIP
jgi:hypothetical protein